MTFAPAYVVISGSTASRVVRTCGARPSSPDDSLPRGAATVISLVSPFAADRDAARALHEATGVVFVEVWLDTPLAECEGRDPKGLYARARRGELVHFTGVDDPYEPPATPDLVLTPQDGDPVDCAQLVLHVLAARFCGSRV